VRPLSSLALRRFLITLAIPPERKTTIDVTDLIWKRTRMAGFSLFAQSTDRDRRRVAGHHPADCQRIRQADR